MTDSTEAPKTDKAEAARAVGLTDDVAALVLSHPARWTLLRRLCGGEALPVKYLAGLARMPSSTCTRHLAVLKKAGLVEYAYGRLYRMPPAWIERCQDGWLDLGPVGLRVPAMGQGIQT